MQTALKILITILTVALLSACGSQENTENNGENQESNMADSSTNTVDSPVKSDTEIEAYKADNIKYLEENALKDGWATTDSGLQYKIIEKGEGENPTVDQYVTVNYEGHLIDGTEFDSSYKRGEPATFPAGRLVQGWVEALSLMSPGAVWELAIPAGLAYGDTDRGPIPAHSTLLFKVELITVKTEEDLIMEIQKPQNAYLEENAKTEGVNVTESGLQYKVITAGDGDTSPTTSSSVKVHYAGRLIDGTEFDSSYKRGEPIVFGVTQVIPGWTEALQLMKVGDKWEVTIPQNLGYGERGAGASIPPFATLIFEVELLEVIDQ